MSSRRTECAPVSCSLGRGPGTCAMAGEVPFQREQCVSQVLEAAETLEAHL